MVKYTGGGLTDYRFIVDFDKMTFTTISQNMDPGTQNIVKVIDGAPLFNIDIVNDKNEITSVFVDKALHEFDGLVMVVRWNTMQDGIPLTKGWFSRNISLTQIR